MASTNGTKSRATRARAASVAPSLGEMGGAGSNVFSTNPSADEYNTNLQGLEGYRHFDRMRKSDGQVRAALAAVKLPILRAYWRVEPASDRAEDRLIADMADHDLENMAIPFISVMRQALLMLDFGSHPFEAVWKLGLDGLVHIDKFGPRAPASIVEYNTDVRGDLLSIKQQVIGGDGALLSPTIPRSKLVMFVNEQEGANWRGISILRAAYMHWHYKSGFYKIDAIAKEKRSVGIDVGTLAADSPDKATHKPELEQAMMTLSSHEKQFFIEDAAAYTYRLETGGDRIADALPSIEHHDLRILRSILVEFLGMGSGSTGSLAMHKDKSAFFLMSLEAICDHLAGVFTTEYLRRWVDFNWIVDEYPRFKYSRLDTRAAKEIADAVSTLVNAGALTVDEGLEHEMRVILDLPQRSPVDTIGAEPAVVEAVEAAVEEVAAKQIVRVVGEAMRAANAGAAASLSLRFRREMVAGIAAAWPDPSPERAAIRAKTVADVVAGRMKAALIAGIEAQDRVGERNREDLESRMRRALDGAIAPAMRAVG